MNPSCYQLNPLQRGGTSQDQRYLMALLTDANLVDARDIKDLITFVDDYATLLAYYNQNNQWDGDWQSLIRSDPLTFLARIGHEDYKTTYNTISENYHKTLYKLRYELTDEHNNDLSSEAYREHIAKYYKPVFNQIFKLFWTIEADLHQIALVNTPLRTQITNEISGQLRHDLQSLIAYYKGGSHPNSPDGNDAGSIVQAGLLPDIIHSSFSNIWIAPPYTGETWADYCNNIQANREIYGDPTWETWQRIDYSLIPVKAIFNRAYAAYVRIINQSNVYFQENLNQVSDHIPHMTLLLAFLQLFQYVQQDFNQLTENHLRFYFRDGLQLREKPATPDTVHLLITLAKQQQTDYRIKAGTELKAGKDKTGKDLIYQVTEDWIINKASVVSFNPEFLLNGQPLQRQIVKATSSELPQWQYFELSSASETASQASQVLADIGWAIASPILRLKEGKRTITFTFHLAPNLASKQSLPVNLLEKYINENLEVCLSGEKQWVERVLPASTKLRVTEDKKSRRIPRDNQLKITIILDESVLPIVNYNPEVHIRDSIAELFDTEWPIALFILKQDKILPADRTRFENLILDQIGIEVKVENIKTLILQNELGVVDPSKPFQPFGIRPSVGSTLYIGCQEALTKPLSSLSLNLEWMGLPTKSFQTYYSYNKKNPSTKLPTVGVCLYLPGQKQDVLENSDFKVKLALLNQGTWSNPPLEQILFKDEIPSFELNWATPLKLDPNLPSYDRYSSEVKGGFLRLELSSPPDAFGHALFQIHYVQQIMAMTRPNAPQGLTLPNEPYTPTIKSLTLGYTANITIPGNDPGQTDNLGRFFHIHSKGIQHLKWNTNGIRLLSQISAGSPQELDSDTAQLTQLTLDRPALYIGIQDIHSPQALSLLFQVLEGSEDASIDPSSIFWSYLAQEKWKPLESQKHLKEDATSGLQGSGIIRFVIPGDATSNHKILSNNSKWYWLRATIEERETDKKIDRILNQVRALPQLIDVQSQAIRAKFVDRNNDPQHLAVPLEAGKITKLLIPDAAIREIKQPYPSFGGQMAESSTTFNHRVSERLRHKQRALTIWDYERLVLEKFPFIYKVKCLNHTNDFNHTNDAGQSDATELAPGCVCLVVVPDIRQKVYGDRFQPQVSNRDRQKITDFLQGISPPCINLKVENPRYEAVKVICEIAFRAEPDIGRLNSDIQRYLAPWAFDASQPLEFGRSLHQSQLIKFIEDLPYIDYVKTLELRVYLPLSTQPSQTVDEVIASTSRSILTSALSHDLQSV